MDPILYWNEVALEADRVAHTNGKNEQTGPVLSSRALAIVHLAMYDALAAVVDHPGPFTPYLPALPEPHNDASPDAAVAAAAHATLSKLYPSQKTFFDLKHAQSGVTGPGMKEGHEFGLLVAQRILADRQGDPGVSDDGYAASIARGAHRVDPDNPDQGFYAPFYGANSRCFSVQDPGRHPLSSPPALDSTDYINALQQVRGKGIAPELLGSVPADSRRTTEETLIGEYWAYDGAIGLGTPPRLYNEIVREVALNKPNPSTGNLNTAIENARLFALVNVAMADAGILAWEQKYIHDFWRPVVGIREHDSSMGPTGEGKHDVDLTCHPYWLPLGAPATNSMRTQTNAMYPCLHTSTVTVKNFTPPFPAYPSGHATFGAAAFHITRRFYGIGADDKSRDDLFADLTFVSEEHNGESKDNKGTVRPKHVRTFPDGLWQMILENGQSRIYLGVHWIFDAYGVHSSLEPDFSQNVGGIPLGINIANDIFNTGMKKSTV